MDKDTIVGGPGRRVGGHRGPAGRPGRGPVGRADPVPGLVGARRDLAHPGHRDDPVRQQPAPCRADLRARPHVHNDIGELNEVWVESLRAEPPAQMLERLRAVTARAAGRADEHDRAGLPRAVLDARRPGHLRAVHADPGLRLLDARAGHPRRGRPAGQRGRAGRAAVGGRDRAGPGLPGGQAGPGPGRLVGDLRPDRAAAAPTARGGGGPGPAGRRAARAGHGDHPAAAGHVHPAVRRPGPPGAGQRPGHGARATRTSAARWSARWPTRSDGPASSGSGRWPPDRSASRTSPATCS